MAKSIKSIYISSEVLTTCEEKKIDISGICEQALKLACAMGNNQGQNEEILALHLKEGAEKEKNIASLKRLYNRRNEKNGEERFSKALTLFCNAYNVERNVGLFLAAKR